MAITVVSVQPVDANTSRVTFTVDVANTTLAAAMKNGLAAFRAAVKTYLKGQAT